MKNTIATKYVYKFVPSRKISEKRYRMAQVTVYDLRGNMIGSYGWSHLSKRTQEQDIQYMVDVLIREYELKKAFSRISNRPEIL